MPSSLARHSRALELLLANRTSGRLPKGARWGEGLQDVRKHGDMSGPVSTCSTLFNYKILQMFGIITTRYIVSSIIPYSITLINTYWKILKDIEIYWNILKVFLCRRTAFWMFWSSRCRAFAGGCTGDALATDSSSQIKLILPRANVIQLCWSMEAKWLELINFHQVISSHFHLVNLKWILLFGLKMTEIAHRVMGCQWMPMDVINSKSGWNAQQTAETCCVLYNASVCIFSADLQRHLWAVLGLRIAYCAL